MAEMTRFDISPRPHSLSEVATAALAGGEFDALLHEFLDTFYLSDPSHREASLRDEPPTLAPIKDAYLAAVAEHLALRFGLTAPAWTEQPCRFLSEPFFAGGLEGLKPLLLVESPLAFRRRLIFVSHDALSRPRDPAVAARLVS
jgi:hypothetical protein